MGLGLIGAGLTAALVAAKRRARRDRASAKGDVPDIERFENEGGSAIRESSRPRKVAPLDSPQCARLVEALPPVP